MNSDEASTRINAARYTDAMYQFEAAVLRDIGPRESCSDAERRLGQRLADLWRGLGHEVRIEPFTCHPKAFLGFVPFAALLYLAAIVAYWISPLLCVVCAGVAAAAIVLELLRYGEFVDPLFPTGRGENVIGVVAPRGAVERRVIVSAHLDSAYEFNLWLFLENAAIPVMVLAFGAVLVPLCGGLAKLLADGAIGSHGFAVIGWIGMALYPFVGLLLFFHTYTVVPGAMDDLAGVAVVHGVAQALADAARASDGSLEHTEVVLLGASSEEAGLRGAKRFVDRHRGEFRLVPTCGIFLDGVYDERFLTVVPRELTTGARHDPRLVALAQEAAKAHGWPMRTRMIPFGGTDAAAFSVAGVPAVALLCQDISRLVPHYHTRYDTLDKVRPESLTVLLQLVLDMLGRIDRQGLESLGA